MKISIGQIVLLCLFQSTLAFTPLPRLATQRSLRLFSTKGSSLPDVDQVALKEVKGKLLDLAKKLHAENGLQVFAKGPKAELKKAAEDLETKGIIMSKKLFGRTMDKSKFLGDWTLLITTATNREGVDTARIEETVPSFFFDPIIKLRSTILDIQNKYLVVQQKIKSTNDNGLVDRIDHTLELEPPKKLRDLLDSLPEQLSNVNINPLSVTKSKLVLVHNATMVTDDEDEEDSFRTKLTLQSIVLNVAGTSQILDPNGKDVAGINIPSLGDFLSMGEFKTTYMDDDLRISRGKIGPIEQLRIFVRTEKPTTKYYGAQPEDDEIVDIESAIADVDVKMITDPEVEAPSDVESDEDGEDLGL